MQNIVKPVITSEVVIEIVRLLSNILTPIGVLIIGYWMRRLEKNTNSIKDALVVATRAEGILEGKTLGHAAGKAEAEALSGALHSPAPERQSLHPGQPPSEHL